MSSLCPRVDTSANACESGPALDGGHAVTRCQRYDSYVLVAQRLNDNRQRQQATGNEDNEDDGGEQRRQKWFDENGHPGPARAARPGVQSHHRP